MAGIDTADKRSSAVNVGSPWRGMWPSPTALDQPDRQHIAFMYRGISAGAGTPVVPDIPVVIRPGGGNANKQQRPWRWWEKGEPEVRKIAKAKVAAAIQDGLLVELTRAGVRAYTTDTVQHLVPEISDEALKEITARIVASLHRIIAQQRQDDDDEEAFLLSAH